MRYFWLSLGLTLLLTACASSQQQVEQADFDTADEKEFAQQLPTVLNNLDAVRLTDSSAFPFVYQGPGQSNLFEAYSMRFILRYEFPLLPLINSKVPWINPDNYNENNGFFATYIRNGRQVELNNPYIQIQYINKALPSCGTVDSVYQWLDSQFLNFPDAKITVPNQAVPTVGGDVAIMQDYQSTSQEGRRPKYLSYAYIDYNADYIIGLGLTTMTLADYEDNRALFKSMVQSFRRF